MIEAMMVSASNVILWVLSAVASLVSVRIIQHIASERARKIIDRLWQEVMASVMEVYQTYVEAIKEGRADGHLTDEEKAEAKKRAVAILKSNLGRKGLVKLSRVIGIEDMDAFLGSKIEAGIAKAKLMGKAVSSPLAVAPGSLSQ